MLILETVVLLMACAVALGWLARRLDIVYPIMLVLGGVALGFIPQLPQLRFDPDLILVVVLPPILYQAAIFTSWRDFRANLRPISLLAVGLVLATTVAVAATAKWLVPELPWAAAFVLGAIVSPPDAAAATSIIGRLKLPRRMIVILEGESLVNDATGLVLYKFAVAAVVTGTFSLADAGAQFVLVALGGIAIGVALGWLFVAIHNQLHDALIETLLSVILPYSAYLIAEQLQVSGVLAVVAAGLVRGRHAPEVFSAEARLLWYSLWSLIAFVMNTLVFILIGLQLNGIVHRVAGFHAFEHGLAIALVAILVRMLWMYPGAYVPRMLSRRIRESEPMPPLPAVTLMGWCGMRGIVSLAAALALPEFTDALAPFPRRDLLIFLAFAVIVITLVAQGLTIKPLIRILGIGADWTTLDEERMARSALIEAALAEITRIEREGATPREVIEHVRADYEARRAHAHISSLVTIHGDEPLRRTRLAATRAERVRLLELWRNDAIGDHVLHQIEREIDLDQARLAR